MKSSCPSFVPILKYFVRHNDYHVTLIYAPYAKCRKIQMASSTERFANTN